MEKIDRVINYFRSLNEEGEGMVASGLSANRVGDGGLTSRGKKLAGYDPVMPGLRRRKNGTPDYRINSKYKVWVKNIESKNTIKNK